MNRPSPDDMKEIIMAEQRAKIKKLEKENKELKAYKSLYTLLKERFDRQTEVENRLILEKNELEKERKEQQARIVLFIVIVILFVVWWLSFSL